MKKIITFLAAAAMSVSLFALDIFTYAPINGNVKSYTQIDYDIASKFGNYFRTPASKIIHVLDNAGRDVEITELNARDVVLNKTIIKYDNYGNVTEQACYDNNSNLLWKNVSTYVDGKKSDLSEYGKDGSLKAKTIYQYADGNLVDETGYDGEGALIWKTIYQYGVNGKVEEQDEYAADGSLDTQYLYTYTDDGKIDSISSYDTYTDQEDKKIFRYAANGTLSEITTYDNCKQVVNRLVIKYDNNGNASKISEYNIAQKFGTTVNELILMTEYTYQ